MAALSHSKYIAAFFLLMLFSCTKAEIAEDYLKPASVGTISVNASIDGSTKTRLEGMKVKWENNDAISLFYSSDAVPSCFSLVSGAGTSSAVFSGVSLGDCALAKYPYSAEDRFQDGYISTNFSEKQGYVPGGFASGVSPMAAVPDTAGNVVFRNLCSVIRVTLTGKTNITSISLTTEDENCYLAGPAKIRMSGGKPVLAIEPTYTPKASITVSGQGFTSLTMECGSVQLSPVTRQTFCFVVPSRVYEGGLSLDVKTDVGSFSKHTGKLDLKSATLYDMEPLNVVINGDLEPSEFLKGSGTSSSPYLVSSVEDLLHIKNATAVKGKITNENGSAGKAAMSAYYLLTRDLDLSVCCGPGVGNWTPLAGRNSFTGHFDGGGHKITGLYINDTSQKGSFFGDVYTGGYLGNLEVSGEVTAENAGIVCGSIYGTVENCIARGKSTAHEHSSAGGVANSNVELMRNCINYADIFIDGDIYLPAGGVSSSASNCVFENCVNYGKVYTETGNCRAGGIVGRIQESVIFNCTNYGDVTGRTHSAGIAGTVFDTQIVSCANYGDIHGSDASVTLCGGICGDVTDPFSHKTGSICNCINTGNVSGGKTNCGICASTVRPIQYCYWLYDTGCGVKNGAIGGTRTGLASLTVNQMKGKTVSPSLYSGYTNPVDAMNAYGFNNSTSDMVLFGWMYDSQSGWPCLTGRAAVPPGQSDKFIQVKPSSIVVNTYAQTFEVTVVSSSEVSMDYCPSWISKKSVSSQVNGTIHYSTFTMNVQQNKSGNERNGYVYFLGSDSGVDSISVTQRYTYISEDYSRDGNVVTLQKASKGAGIDIVLMGDAYTDKDIKNGKYESDIKRGIDAFFSVEPYASFRNLFNIYYVELVSGSNVIGESTALNTYFGSGTFVGGDDATVQKLCKSVTGKTNMDDVTAIVIINTKQYAGTCWMYYSYTGDYGLGFSISYFPLGTATEGQTSMEALIRHEAAGHGFGKLADEYSYQNMGTISSSGVNDYKTRQTYGWWPNVDFTSDPFTIRWSKYIQDNRYASEQIDAYEGGATYWSGVWRPTLNSIMRYNTGQFNAPSREAIYVKIHKLAYGSSWTYDHETFVKYDAVNRSNAAVSMNAVSLDEISSFRPTHPPVLVKD